MKLSPTHGDHGDLQKALLVSKNWSHVHLRYFLILTFDFDLDVYYNLDMFMECCYMPRSPCSRTINAFFMKEKKKTLYSVVQKIFIETLLLFSHSVMSDFLQPYGLHHARLPCPSLSPRICSNSCPLSQ